jgi:UDP-glucose 4-epimerase
VYRLETVSLRYFNVFGPRQDPGSQYSGVISRFIDALLNGKQPTIYGDGEQSRDFTYVSNVVDANLRAAESDSAVGHVINVANGERVTINEVFEMVKKLTGRTNLRAEYAPSRTGDVRDSLADLSLAHSLLAYSPQVGLEEGLRLTIDWWTNSRFSKAAG